MEVKFDSRGMTNECPLGCTSFSPQCPYYCKHVGFTVTCSYHMKIAHMLAAKVRVTEENVKYWVQNYTPMQIDDADINHVAQCLYSIVAWYQDERPTGGFIKAVLRENFIDICLQADDMNMKYLPVYAMFLHNCVPLQYRDMIK